MTPSRAGFGVSPGLCGRCVHARVVVNDRGSRFWLCGAADEHPALRKYPPLPVLRCPVFTPSAPEDTPRPPDPATES